MKVLLEEKINFELYGEDHDSVCPLMKVHDHAETVVEVIEAQVKILNSLKQKYPEYNDFQYHHKIEQHRFGNFSAWHNLYGIK